MEKRWSAPVIIALVVAILGAIPAWFQAYTSWEQLRIMQVAPQSTSNGGTPSGVQSSLEPKAARQSGSALSVGFTFGSAVVSLAALVFVAYRIFMFRQNEQSGLRIISARWYCTVFPKCSQDLTKVLRAEALGKDSIELHAHQDAGWGDICDRHGGQGHPKRMEIDYSYKGHAVIQYDRKQAIPPNHTAGDTGAVPGKEIPRSSRPALTIRSALYGAAGTRYVEYQRELQAKIESESLNVPVDNNTFAPDPVYGELKRARIFYKCGDGPSRKMVRREYSQLVLPPDWEMWLEGVVAVLASDCTTVAESYEQLKRDYPSDDRVQRHPRVNHSWPDPGSNWDYAALILHRNNQELDRIEKHAKMLWSKMALKLEFHPLPKWGAVSHMDDLIAEIRRFRTTMLWMVSEDV